MVREAWAQVGVEPGTSGTPIPEEVPQEVLHGRLRVERSGGFVGRTEFAEVDLDDPGTDLADLVRQAVQPPPTEDARPMPDMYVYTFTLEGRAPVTVPEHLLSLSQAELARRVLQPRAAEA